MEASPLTNDPHGASGHYCVNGSRVLSLDPGLGLPWRGKLGAAPLHSFVGFALYRPGQWGVEMGSLVHTPLTKPGEGA